MIKIKNDETEPNYTTEDILPFDDFAGICCLNSFRVIITDSGEHYISYEITYIEDESYREIRSIVISSQKEYKWKRIHGNNSIACIITELVETEFTKETILDRGMLAKDMAKDILDLCVKEKINF